MIHARSLIQDNHATQSSNGVPRGHCGLSVIVNRKQPDTRSTSNLPNSAPSKKLHEAKSNPNREEILRSCRCGRMRGCDRAKTNMGRDEDVPRACTVPSVCDSKRTVAGAPGYQILKWFCCRETRWSGTHKQAGTRAGNHHRHTQQTPSHQCRPTALHEA